jgi:hypothetical protein
MLSSQFAERVAMNQRTVEKWKRQAGREGEGQAARQVEGGEVNK